MTVIQQYTGPDWIRASKYDELTGMTIDSLKYWRSKGELAEGIHWTIGRDGRLWVNWHEMQKWNIDGAAA